MLITQNIGDAGDYEELAPTSSKGITASLLKNSMNVPAKAAYISVQDANINFNVDGSTPTTTAGGDDGHPLVANESMLLIGINNLKNFRCIDQVGASRVKITIYY